MNNIITVSRKNLFPLLAVTVLLLGLTSAVLLSQQSQDKRSRAQTASSSLWDSSATPATASYPDPQAVTLGVKFKATIDGTITGIKFYKGSQNIGTHSATLWTSTGQMLATATFTNETASGWQQVNFSAPVPITANTTYIASYFAPKGYYAVNRSYFTNEYTNGSLTALADKAQGGNGLYKYGSTHSFPTATYQAGNYWVDVLFQPILPTSTPSPAPPQSCETSVICQENQKPGNPASEWYVSTASPSSKIYGYAAQMSVNKGETVQFKVDTDADNYRMDIYRIGYYGGMGARKVDTIAPSAPLPQSQPACLSDATTGLVDCGNWAVSGSWQVPADAVSGVYLANLVRQDGTAGVNHIIFVVRDDNSHSDLLVQTSDATWQAYNTYGGASLYLGNGPGGDGRAYKISYNRPCCQKSNSTFFTAEYPMIRWLEANGYNVSYTTNVDTTNKGSELLGHKIFLSSGHDEYWSAEMRNNVENARNNGVNLAFFSANEAFWKTRWENSIDGSNAPYRTLVSYKETAENAKIDPSPEWTGTWRDPRFAPPSDGGRPENALTGQLFMVNGNRNDAIVVPAEYGNLRFWRNTAIAAGQSVTFPSGTLGYEWDEVTDNGFSPAGLIRMSSTTLGVNPLYVQESSYGSSFGPGIATHNLSLYRHPSGALIFGAGTTQWAWGLDATHDFSGAPTDSNMQQATVNLFADMGVQPITLQPGLIPATKSTDMTPPVAAITKPSDGSSVSVGYPVTIEGTASDTNGVVGGVEVSVDGGTTWHLATGRTNWKYDWTPASAGTTSIKVRAVDDSGNIQTTTSTNDTITLTVTEQICPCSMWTANDTPSNTFNDDRSAVELGFKFQATNAGYITGIKFYKGLGSTGTHTGSLWTNTGTRLAQATFTNETTSGWQQVNFSSPVPIAANTTYIASYFAPQGRYATSKNYFTKAITHGKLATLADGANGGNGVYKYNTSSAFPTDSSSATNYWIDVVFELPTSMWNEATTPAIPAYTDPASVNLGLKFQPTVDGYITGMKFYKGSTNTGIHIGSLWSSTGQLLGQTTFTNETTSGWQQVNFSSPVPVTANTTYVASYFAPQGRYAVNTYYFGQSILNGKLFAPANAGVYVYSSSPQFPNKTYKSSNYWVDVLFKPNN